MRFAFAVYPFLGYNVPNLFLNEDSFAEFEKALHLLKENGFAGVKLSLHFTDEPRLSKIRKIIDRSGLKLAAIGTGLVVVAEGCSFTDKDQKKRAKAVQIIKGLLRFAAVDNSTVSLGFIRGANKEFIPDRGSQPADVETAQMHMRECIVECDRAAKDAGATLGMEPINRYDAPFLNTADEVDYFIKELKLSSTRLILDMFQMSMEETSILATVAKYATKLAAFHIEDSNRWPPTFGNLKIEDSLHILAALGYQGWVTAETLPKPNRLEALETTARFLKLHRFI